MKRLIRIGLTVSMKEKEALSRLALIEGGLSKAALIRRLIRQTAIKKGVWDDLTTTAQEKVKTNPVDKNL